MVNAEDSVVGGGGSNPSMALFFLTYFFISFSFHLIFASLYINFFENLPNQTDVAIDEELEKVIISIYSSSDTDMGDNESG